MKKFLYIMPAVLICMLYALLTVLAGGIGGYQPIVLLYVCAPLLAGILLRRNKWWGSIFGIAVGAILVYMGSQSNGQPIGIERPMGIVFILYYLVMGILCLMDTRKKNKK